MHAYIDKKRAREISPEALSLMGSPELVYVRETTIEDLQKDLPTDMTAPALSQLEPGTKLYALHAANGAYMAVVDSWNAAISMARHNEYTPVSVH